MNIKVTGMNMQEFVFGGRGGGGGGRERSTQ